jgi:hypothetical protein
MRLEENNLGGSGVKVNQNIQQNNPFSSIGASGF